MPGIQNQLLLRPSRLKWLGSVAVGLIGSAAFFSVLVAFPIPLVGVIMFSAGLLCFVPITVFAALQLTRLAGLVLDTEGFTIFRPPFSPKRYRWTDVRQGFRPLILNRRVWVGFGDSVTPTRWERIDKWVLLRSGLNRTVPDTYGMSASELAELLNKWRNRATGAQGTE